MLVLAALFIVGLLAGAMNAIAGGGSFVTFPVLVLAGLPPIVANASSTVALFPGGLGSIWAYRNDLRPRFAGVALWALVVVSVIGGLVGALLLLFTPQTTFDAVVPWILLLATVTFAFGRHVGTWLQGRWTAGPATILGLQLGLGLYGGYFGGAVGIMMMAAWTVVTQDDAKVMTQHRSLLVNAANSVALLCFVVAGKVAWPDTTAVLVGAVAGGYWGARYARRLDAGVIRGVVIAVSALVTAWFFARSI